MNEQTKPIHTLAKCGLVLQIICTGLNIGFQIFALPLMKLIHQSVNAEKLAAASRNPLGYVMPLLGIAVYLLLYFLLRTQIEHPSASAGTVLILILTAVPVMSVISLIFNLFVNQIIARLYDAETMGALAYIKSIAGFLTVISSITYPLLAAAAGMNWQRCRNLTANQ